MSNFPQLRGHCLSNYTSDPVFRALLAQSPEENMQAAVLQWVQLFGNPLTWDDLPWLRSLTDLPLVLKGICHPDDVRRAKDGGVDGIYCSTHGGRQANGGLPAIDCLPGVVEAADGTPVLFDSGIRSGADIVKALALGATAVGVGRPYAYGLAIGGEDGIVHVLRSLLAETDLIMAVDGYPTLAASDSRHAAARHLNRNADLCDGREVETGGQERSDPGIECWLEEFDEYLALERGRSEHTRRAYLGDLRSLFDFLAHRNPDAGLRGLSLPALRSWLATQASAGAARATLARRTSAVKTFTAWATAARTDDRRPGDPPAGAQGASHASGGVAPGPGASTPWMPRNPVPSKVIHSLSETGSSSRCCTPPASASANCAAWMSTTSTPHAG